MDSTSVEDRRRATEGLLHIYTLQLASSPPYMGGAWGLGMRQPV